jgi:hypothetical protein
MVTGGNVSTITPVVVVTSVTVAGPVEVVGTEVEVVGTEVVVVDKVVVVAQVHAWSARRPTDAVSPRAFPSGHETDTRKTMVSVAAAGTTDVAKVESPAATGET